MKKLLVSVAALSLIAGCSDKGADRDGDGKITAEEVAEEMNKVTLEPGQWENTVEIVDVKIDGLPDGVPASAMDSMKEMACNNMGGGPGEMTMTMDGQYGPSSYDMTMNMIGGAAGMKMNISAKSNGKRIGSCPTG